MGAEASKDESEHEDVRSTIADLKTACEGKDGKPDFKAFKDAFDTINKIRRKKSDLDETLIQQHQLMKYVKFALRQPENEWKAYGVKVARSFFHIEQAREKIAKMEFVQSILVMTLPDANYTGDNSDNDEDDNSDDDSGDGDDESQEQPRKARKADTQIQLQVIATETFREMAQWSEFVGSLCDTAVLNFLCIVLNGIPEAAEMVTCTFVKLCENEQNLAFLMEGAVGDILESFFKTVKFIKPTNKNEDDLRRWQTNVAALSHCAETLGTLKKFKHQCQVDLSIIIRVFNYALHGQEQLPLFQQNRPDFVCLSAEMSRLLYWICRLSKNVTRTLQDAVDGDVGIDMVLTTIVRMWEKSMETYNAIQDRNKRQSAGLKVSQDFVEFCVNDLDRGEPIAQNSKELEEKIRYAEIRLCYLNCLLWVLLPVDNLRWKLKVEGLRKLYLAFELTRSQSRLLEVILGTARYIVDLPKAQECRDLIVFFGEQLLILLHGLIEGDDVIKTTTSFQLLLDAISILAMQREMQELLAEFGIWEKLALLSDKPIAGKEKDEKQKTELSMLRIWAQVALHPSHRLTWVSKNPDGAEACYPPRDQFMRQMEGWMKRKSSTDNFKTIASILLTIFGEDKLIKDSVEEVLVTFKSVLGWWQVNTTARYQEEKDAADDNPNGHGREAVDATTQTPLDELIRRAIQWKIEGQAITCMETMPYCAPHECVFALTLFSRLALEPKFKVLFDRDALTAILGCICVGVWPEAREAAAVLANLMWLPDLKHEMLVCWLKFDGPRCVTVDAANVLLPIRIGQPKGADIGKGMYRSAWGIEFTEGTCVTLHPDGLTTHLVPGMLTSASPADTFANTSRKEYQWLSKDPLHPKHFTITCWFYWPLGAGGTHNKVLIQSTNRMSQIYLFCEEIRDPKNPRTMATWMITDEHNKVHAMKTPTLQPGWHMLALVSSTDVNEVQPFNGTKFFLDDRSTVHEFWVKNDFYMVGNDATQEGKSPFGLVADFRIYARSLPDSEIRRMLEARTVDSHPDQIVTRLAQMNAAAILAQRLDCPDSAVECLRALGSLASKSTERARIYSVCGAQVLRLLNSPLPQVQRMAARLLNNLT